MTWGNGLFSLLIITPSGGFTGLFLYSPGPGPGNLIGSWTSAPGVDPYGNAYPGGINVTSGVLSGVALQALTETLNPGPLLLYSNANTSVFLFTTSGTFTPSSNGTVIGYCVGPGGNGALGAVAFTDGGGGGGGEAAEDTDTVTASTPYTVTVGTGGSGTATTVTFTSVTVTAHAGSAGTSSAGGVGGTGSSNATHFNGGHGGASATPAGGGGGGGASSASTGGNGAAPTGGTGGVASGVLPASGNGGTGAIGAGAGSNGAAYGGGGGGGPFAGTAGTGAAGVCIIVFTASGGSVKLLASIAGAAGTDPATGTNYDAGVSTYNTAFGTFVSTVGGVTTWGGPFNNNNVQISSGNRLKSTSFTNWVANLSDAQSETSTHTVTAASATQLTGAWTIPVNDASVGTVYRVTAWGNGQQGSTAETLAMECSLASGTNLVKFPTTFSAINANFSWRAVMDVQVVTTGAGGTCNISLAAWIGPPSAGGGATGSAQAGYASAAALNTTTSNSLNFDAAWGAVTGVPTISGQGSTIERLGP